MTHSAYSHEPEHMRSSVGKTINSKALWAVILVAIFVVGFPAYLRGTEPEDTIPNPTPTVDSVTDVEGNVYKTVKIGNQVWISGGYGLSRRYLDI